MNHLEHMISGTEMAEDETGTLREDVTTTLAERTALRVPRCDADGSNECTWWASPNDEWGETWLKEKDSIIKHN